MNSEPHKRGSISKILSFKSSHKRERKLAETVSNSYYYPSHTHNHIAFCNGAGSYMVMGVSKTNGFDRFIMSCLHTWFHH